MQLFRVKSSALQALQVSNLCPSVNSDPTRDANSGVPMGGGRGQELLEPSPTPTPILSFHLV